MDRFFVNNCCDFIGQSNDMRLMLLNELLHLTIILSFKEMPDKAFLYPFGFCLDDIDLLLIITDGRIEFRIFSTFLGYEFFKEFQFKLH